MHRLGDPAPQLCLDEAWIHTQDLDPEILILLSKGEREGSIESLARGIGGEERCGMDSCMGGDVDDRSWMPLTQELRSHDFREFDLRFDVYR